MAKKKKVTSTDPKAEETHGVQGTQPYLPLGTSTHDATLPILVKGVQPASTFNEKIRLSLRQLLRRREERGLNN